jgi:hypothetical protein
MRRYGKVFLICFFIFFLSISVSYAQQVNVPLIGTGIGIPNISVTPTSSIFGNVNIGSSSSPQTFTVSNTGSANLVIGTTSITGTDASQFSKQNDSCSGKTLTPSSSCSVNTVFSPASTGSKSVSLSIPSNDPDTPTLNVPLIGTGVGIPNISVTPASYNFGNVNMGSSSSPQIFSVSNTGTGDLIIGIISFTGTDASQFGKQSDNCSGQTLAPSSNCTLQAVFTPISAGVKSANLTIPSNDPDTPTFYVPLSGTGVQTNSITVSVTNGSESWQAGTTYTIRWTYTGNPGSKVKVELLKGGSVNRTIISSTSIGSRGNGSYNWTMPVTQTGGTDYKIKVTSTSNSSYTDTSDNNFTIIASSITVTVPNGGENWKAGITQTIRWTYTANPGANVKIELLKRGSLNRTIKFSTSIGSGGNGSYNWAIPSTQTAATDYKIRITSTTNSSYTDTSDNNFTVSK